MKTERTQHIEFKERYLIKLEKFLNQSSVKPLSQTPEIWQVVELLLNGQIFPRDTPKIMED